MSKTVVESLVWNDTYLEEKDQGRKLLIKAPSMYKGKQNGFLYLTEERIVFVQRKRESDGTVKDKRLRKNLSNYQSNTIHTEGENLNIRIVSIVKDAKSDAKVEDVKVFTFLGDNARKNRLDFHRAIDEAK